MERIKNTIYSAGAPSHGMPVKGPQFMGTWQAGLVDGEPYKAQTLVVNDVGSSVRNKDLRIFHFEPNPTPVGRNSRQFFQLDSTAAPRNLSDLLEGSTLFSAFVSFQFRLEHTVPAVDRLHVLARAYADAFGFHDSLPLCSFLKHQEGAFCLSFWVGTTDAGG